MSDEQEDRHPDPTVVFAAERAALLHYEWEDEFWVIALSKDSDYDCASFDDVAQMRAFLQGCLDALEK